PWSGLTRAGGAATGPLRRLDLERGASGAIYGTIITASTMVGVAEGVHHPRQIAVTVAVTLVLYAIAHAYSNVLGSPGGRAPSWGAFARELASEGPMLTACLLPLVVMAVLSLLGAGLDLAVEVALLSAVVTLFAWGLVAARRAHSGAVPQLLSAAAFGLVGLGIVGLRVATGH
ncbi:MAG TPA: hypothetical protein VLW53_01055, partial [Candidatus Eisenbacteria bacterium]|nr:hypothetical protein [Candidatus Eisenbacteria bacterium]